ncbi:FkbM family methyltransferase [Aliikangiella sp. IMCC44653]
MKKYLSLVRSILKTTRMRMDVIRGVPVHFNFRGNKYWVNADKSALYHIANSTAKISNMTDLIPSETRTIFDVGANCGLFSAFAERSCPNATIHCFEPSSELLPIVERNISSKRVIVHGVAVGERDEQLGLYVNASSQQTNSMNREAVELFAGPNRVESRVVPCIALDNFASENGIKSIDVLKVDVQGYEGAVFRGCRKLLPTVDMLFVESTWLDVESIVEIIPFALDNGFTYASVLNPVHMGADILFSRREVKSPLIKIAFPISEELLTRRWR